ncbi:MAG: hypothetical protein IJA78_05365 [Clostridia bacterium]|nr:hypothetical protein [Clostridia bacterium]
MDILYQDRDLVVTVKPRGVLAQAGEGENMPALLAPSCGTVFPVHRLDRAVGGVMVYAKTRAAAAALSASVTKGELEKQYVAVVAGLPEPAEGELRDLLYHDARQNKTFVVDHARKGAKEAILRYRVTQTVQEGDNTLSRVEIRLLTGRSHQIRVQFGSRGWPLVGDGKYGSRIKARYLALFAASLAFLHPTSGKICRFTAEVPTDYPWSAFGAPHLEIERKYLIAYPDVAQLCAIEGCRVRHMVQTYLTAPKGETRRVRRIEEQGSVCYIETVKHRVSALTAIEDERALTAADYERALALADPARRPIEKTRYAFPYAGHTVEVDVYPFWQDRAIAEVELADEREAVVLPPFLRVIREVTDDVRYKNVRLAREIPFDEI